MKGEEKLKEKIGSEVPFTVPKGYFEHFTQQLMNELPQPAEAPKEIKLSNWQRFRPYIYMAAMFVGIWLMMRVFYNVSNQDSINLDNMPENIAMAMVDDDVESYDLLSTEESDEQLMEDVAGQYNSMEDFERDFGYQLLPEYRNSTNS